MWYFGPGPDWFFAGLGDTITNWHDGEESFQAAGRGRFVVPPSGGRCPDRLKAELRTKRPPHKVRTNRVQVLGSGRISALPAQLLFLLYKSIIECPSRKAAAAPRLGDVSAAAGPAPFEPGATPVRAPDPLHRSRPRLLFTRLASVRLVYLVICLSFISHSGDGCQANRIK